MVSIIWRRGKRELESKAGTIEVHSKEAKIDDIFTMKTSIEYDVAEEKFQPKMSVLELVFQETKAPIGHVEFDFGKYANQMRNKSMTATLDLKSDQFPGAQIKIYYNIQILEDLPVKEAKKELDTATKNLIGVASAFIAPESENMAST